jgi:hypothetical protein
MQRLAWMIGVVAFSIFTWHLVETTAVREQARRLGGKRVPPASEVTARVNPVTNLVRVRISTVFGSKKGGGLGEIGAALESALGEAVSNLVAPAIERDLNFRARERYDLYAMLLPYRVRVEGGSD